MPRQQRRAASSVAWRTPWRLTARNAACPGWRIWERISATPLRVLRLNPGFTAAAVLSLALGIGASTAIFSMFHTLMLRMLPVRQPEQLVSLYRTGGWGSGIASYPLYQEIGKRSDLFQGVIGSTTAAKTHFRTGSGDRLESVQSEFVTGNYFGVLGVAPALGRVFSPADDRTPHAHPVVVLSYDFWRNRFGGDPAIVGRGLVLDDQPMTVIGVGAAGFRGIGVDRAPDLWAPMMMVKSDLHEPGMNLLWIVARRQPWISRQKAQSAVDVVLQQFLTSVYGSHPNAAFRKTAMTQHIEVRDAGLGLSRMRDRFGKPLTILMAAVLLVLLAACVNVANLLLARGAARQKEIALRVSLGATRGRLVRQALTESLLLAMAGGAFGIGLAFWGIRGLLRFLPLTSGNPFQSAPDMSVLAFCLAASLASVLLFGLAPALRTTAVDPVEGLRTSDGRTRGGQTMFRRALVVAQVAFSVVLAVLAGLFGQSLGALRSIDVGFRNQEVMEVSLDLPDEWKPEVRKAARERVMAQLSSLPGVSAVTFGMPGPYMQGTASATIKVPGSTATANEPAWVNYCELAPGYFAMLGSPLVAGREFDRNDKPGTQSVALVNQAFVRKFLPDEKDPLQRLVNSAHIVGVVRDMLNHGVREKREPAVYYPASLSTNWGSILVQSTHSPKCPRAGHPQGNGAPRAASQRTRTAHHPAGDRRFDIRGAAALYLEWMLRRTHFAVGGSGTVRRGGIWNGAAGGRNRHPHRAGRAARLGALDGAARRPVTGGGGAGYRASGGAGGGALCQLGAVWSEARRYHGVRCHSSRTARHRDRRGLPAGDAVGRDGRDAGAQTRIDFGIFA